MKTIKTTIYEAHKPPQEIALTGESRFGKLVGAITVEFAGAKVCSLSKATELQGAVIKTLRCLRSQAKCEHNNKHIADLELIGYALFELASGGRCQLNQEGAESEEDALKDFREKLDMQDAHLLHIRARLATRTHQ